MRKKLTVLIFLFLPLLSPKLIYAQTPVSVTPELYKIDGKFDEYYKTYISKIEEYQKAHEEYVFRKSQYLRYGTLKSQEDAFSATAQMIQARDSVLISYLYSLKSRLKESLGIIEAKIQVLDIRLDDEIGWFTNHKDTVPSAGTLNDLVVDSEEANKRWLLSLNPLAYEVLSTIAYGRNLDFSKRLDESFFKTKNKLEQVRSDTREGYSFSESKFVVLDRWVFEIDNKLNRSKEKQIEAESMINQLIKLKKDYLPSYNRITTVIGESELYLKEGSTYLREIINELKKSED